MTGNETLSGGQLSAAISDEIVRILSEHTGRGPTRAKTTISDSLIACVLEDTLTRGERTLVEGGRDSLVLEMRSNFQAVMKTDCVEAVERLSGRRVRAFMSQNNIAPDLGVELFVMEPNGDGAAAVESDT
jgi:uncharacterized protein YbcI